MLINNPANSISSTPVYYYPVHAAETTQHHLPITSFVNQGNSGAQSMPGLPGTQNAYYQPGMPVIFPPHNVSGA